MRINPSKISGGVGLKDDGFQKGIDEKTTNFTKKQRLVVEFILLMG